MFVLLKMEVLWNFTLYGLVNTHNWHVSEDHSAFIFRIKQQDEGTIIL
jgi:hypothetical protein